MTIIYITENNCRCYAVTLQNNNCVSVQNFKDGSLDENIIYTVNPIKTFLGKSQSCTMTALSGAFNKECFDGNTILLKVGVENNKNKYVYIGGDMVCSFLTNDTIYKYISNMGNNLIPYSIGIGRENIYYLTPYFRIVKKEKIDENDFNKLFGIDYDDIMKREKIEINKIHSNYDDDGDDDDDVDNRKIGKSDFVTAMNQLTSLKNTNFKEILKNR